MTRLLILLLIVVGTSFFKNSKVKKQNDVIHQIPIVCYHNLGINPGGENQFYIGEQQFNRQMKALYDSGYHAILPNQLVAYYQRGTTLPQKPIIITFDDSHVEHYSIAAAVLERYGFKGVFFAMTVCIDKKGFLSSTQSNNFRSEDMS